MEPLAVGTSVCVGEVLDRVREEGKIMEATTPGTFMMIEGDKVYPTFLEMLRDQPQQPDPVFEEGDVMPTMEDKGVPLGALDDMDIEFKKMYTEMFSRTNELGVIGAGDFEARLKERQNELSESKGENPNGGSISVLSSGGPTLHAFERAPTPFHFAVQIPCAGAIVSTPEERGDAGDTDVDDRGAGSSVDS
jgi:hypothetical protein